MKSEYLLPFVVDEMIQNNGERVKVLTATDKWYGVTYKPDHESVVAALQALKDNGTYPEKLWE